MKTKTDTTILRDAVNHKAWAIGREESDGRIYVRRIVWGRVMARAEKRKGEVIRRAEISIREEIIG